MASPDASGRARTRRAARAPAAGRHGGTPARNPFLVFVAHAAHGSRADGGAGGLPSPARARL